MYYLFRFATVSFLDSTSTALRTWECTRTHSLADCKKGEEAGNEEYDPCAWCASARDSRWPEKATAHGERRVREYYA